MSLCTSASKTIITEVQSRLYKIFLMKAPFDVDIGGGRIVPYVISVSTATQMKQLSADGWTRVFAYLLQISSSDYRQDLNSTAWFFYLGELCQVI